MSEKIKGDTKRTTGGYIPLNEGYQPKYEKKGYKPAGQQNTTSPKPPKGGTGESPGKRE